MPSRQAAKTLYVGEQLRALLDERFLTQHEFAYKLGASPKTVSRWVLNETAPQKRRLRQIAEFFGVEPAALLAGEPEEQAA